MKTVLECLADFDVTGEEAIRVAAAIGSCLPVDADIRITAEMVDAAREADVGLMRELVERQAA